MLPHDRRSTSLIRGWTLQGIGRLGQPPFVFALSIGLAFAAAAAARILSPSLVIPATVSLLLVLGAALSLAALAVRQRPQGPRLTYWDVAGALTFIGIGLSTLVDGAQLAGLLGEMPERK